MNTFCSYPFDSAFFQPGGDVLLCCVTWLNKPIGNYFTQSFPEIWNSTTAQRIRESILDRSFRYCRADLCSFISTGKTKKLPENERHLKIIRGKKVILEQGPRLMSLNYDFSCNIYCKSCRNRIRVSSLETQRKLIRFQDSLMSSDLFKNVRELTVSRIGEPLASPVYLDLFTKIKQKKLPDLKIVLRTNGLLLTPRNWERMKNVHYAINMIYISIDAATTRTYNRLRRGGDFKKLLDNLSFLTSVKQERGIKIHLNFLVQKKNYREMPKFIKLAQRYHCDSVMFQKLANLGTYKPHEFEKAAIHSPHHPQFNKFKKIINKPIFKDPIVRFCNLSDIAG